MTVIATAGHVDHGKSSLVRALTGTDPDRLSEEKQRGMTIDLGFAHVATPEGVTLSFVDVPGHVDFICNMIAGVSHVGVVLLVIDSLEGWMPQTTEHCDVVALMGSKKFVVALTKADRVDAARISEVAGEVKERLQDRGVEVVEIIPTSVISGVGIDELRGVLVRAVSQADSELSLDRCRLFIDRVFTMSGAGTVVTGTLQGKISVDDRLTVVRSDVEVRVRSVQTHGTSVNNALGPTRVALNIVGVGTEDLVRGDALVKKKDWVPTVQFDASVRVLPTLEHDVSKRGQYILHVGTVDQEVQLRVLGADQIAPGYTGTVRCTVQIPIPILPGDRFVLRETGRSETVGGGVVLDAHPVVPVMKARPDGTLQSYLAERGWVTISRVWQEMNLHVEPVIDEWVATEEEVARTIANINDRLHQSPQGMGVSSLQPWEQLLLEQISDVTVSHGVARRGAVLSEQEQRIAQAIQESGRTGIDSTSLSRDVMRRLVQHDVAYEHDGIAFHATVLDELQAVLQNLWEEYPNGFTMASLRDATGLTRKSAVPLGTVLDKRGLTKRVGDVRVPGPRFNRT